VWRHWWLGGKRFLPRTVAPTRLLAHLGGWAVAKPPVARAAVDGRAARVHGNDREGEVVEGGGLSQRRRHGLEEWNEVVTDAAPKGDDALRARVQGGVAPDCNREGGGGGTECQEERIREQRKKSNQAPSSRAFQKA